MLLPRVQSLSPNAPVPARSALALTTCLVACAWGSATSQAWAQAAGSEKLPFYLAAAETVMRDSNFSRTDTPVAETVSSTAAKAGLYKEYGRQTYDLSALVARNRYAHYKDLLNYDSKKFSGNFSSGLLSNFKLSLGGSYDEQLNAAQDNIYGGRVSRNIRKTRDGNAGLTYGIDGLWSVSGSTDRNHVDYSEPLYYFQNANQKSDRLGVSYNSTSDLSYGVAVRKVNTYYPVNRSDLTVDELNLESNVNWRVSGLSYLSGNLSRRRSTYSTDPNRHQLAWNGSLDWSYTPQGIFNYGLSISKTSGTDRATDRPVTGPAKAINLAGGKEESTLLATRAVSGTISWLVTGKTSLSASYRVGRTQYSYTTFGTTTYKDTAGDTVEVISTTSNRSSVAHTATLTWTYAILRSLSSQCNASMYSQTRDQNLIRFQGHSLDCTLTVTFDSFNMTSN